MQDNGSGLEKYCGLQSVYGKKMSTEQLRAAEFFDLSDMVVLPGFCDVHVHLREPGFSYKETIATGTLACAHGGFTDVCSMPNLNPVPDSLEHLQPQLEAIQRDACIGVHPYAAITCGEKGREMADLEGMAPYVIGYSDDGKGVQDAGMMREAMQRIKALGKVLAAHCEDESLLHGGYIHAGDYARTHGHAGICSESEWGPIARDLEMIAQIGCAYHVCHVSTKESVELIRQAKKQGLNVTCETGPHYLVMSDADLQEHGRFKMNPPLRAEADRQALLEGILDGTIDMIATDHAPHSAEEKSKGLKGSSFGVVGIETAFPVLYTHLIKTGILHMDKAIDLLAINARKRFGIPFGNDFTIWDLRAQETVDPAKFLSLGKASPFEGNVLYGKCLLTLRGDNTVYHCKK